MFLQRIIQLTALLSLLALARAGPLLNVDNTNLEIIDLNGAAALAKGIGSKEQEKTTFNHSDKIVMLFSNTALSDNFKYDVETIESRDEIKPETEELEERFRGASALRVNKDTFAGEDIEVTSVKNEEGLNQTHILATIALVTVAFVSILLYAAMVMWRLYLEERYGMRELLVTTDDHDSTTFYH